MRRYGKMAFMRKQYESAFILRDETLNGFQNETLYELLPTLGETGQGHPPFRSFLEISEP